MRRFKFKLQKLLDYRDYLEKKEQDKFSKVLGKYVSIENVIKGASEQSANILFDSKTFIDKGDLQLFYYRDQARKGLKTKMIDYNEKLKQQSIPLNKARAELIQAMKDKKVIEILHDKAKLKYKKEAEKEEQTELDDIGIIRRSSS